MARRHSSRSRSARSSQTPNRPPPKANLLLAALPQSDRTRLDRSLDVIPLKLKDLLHKPGEPIQYVYFPAGGFCSVLTALEDGSMVEVATIGREGMVGASAMFDGNHGSSVTMVQAETDTCYRMTAEAFRREMNQHGAFYELITRYGQTLLAFVMQSTACNAVHSVEQRLARWLLTAQDRIESHEFPMTQEFLAMMLGTARPTVTVVAGTLQRAGLITYHRGRVTVLDREQLESASCECYRVGAELLRAATAGKRS
jgi:CRP-like cAMP-binding protein